eukprot:473168_1
MCKVSNFDANARTADMGFQNLMSEFQQPSQCDFMKPDSRSDRSAYHHDWSTVSNFDRLDQGSIECSDSDLDIRDTETFTVDLLPRASTPCLSTADTKKIRHGRSYSDLGTRTSLPQYGYTSERPNPSHGIYEGSQRELPSNEDRRSQDQRYRSAHYNSENFDHLYGNRAAHVLTEGAGEDLSPGQNNSTVHDEPFGLCDVEDPYVVSSIRNSRGSEPITLSDRRTYFENIPREPNRHLRSISEVSPRANRSFTYPSLQSAPIGSVETPPNIPVNDARKSRKSMFERLRSIFRKTPPSKTTESESNVEKSHSRQTSGAHSDLSRPHYSTKSDLVSACPPAAPLNTHSREHSRTISSMSDTFRYDSCTPNFESESSNLPERSRSRQTYVFENPGDISHSRFPPASDGQYEISQSRQATRFDNHRETLSRPRRHSRYQNPYEISHSRAASCEDQREMSHSRNSSRYDNSREISYSLQPSRFDGQPDISHSRHSSRCDTPQEISHSRHSSTFDNEREISHSRRSSEILNSRQPPRYENANEISHSRQASRCDTIHNKSVTRQDYTPGNSNAIYMSQTDFQNQSIIQPFHKRHSSGTDSRRMVTYSVNDDPGSSRPYQRDSPVMSSPLNLVDPYQTRKVSQKGIHRQTRSLEIRRNFTDLRRGPLTPTNHRRTRPKSMDRKYVAERRYTQRRSADSRYSDQRSMDPDSRQLLRRSDGKITPNDRNFGRPPKDYFPVEHKSIEGMSVDEIPLGYRPVERAQGEYATSQRCGCSQNRDSQSTFVRSPAYLESTQLRKIEPQRSSPSYLHRRADSSPPGSMKRDNAHSHAQERVPFIIKLSEKSEVSSPTILSPHPSPNNTTRASPHSNPRASPKKSPRPFQRHSDPTAVTGGSGAVLKRAQRSKKLTKKRSKSAADANESVVDLESLQLNCKNMKYKRGELIGKGSSGKVYMGMTAEGKLVAIKQIPVQNTEQEKKATRLVRELELLGQLRHPNIVTLYGSEIVRDKMNIIMEFVPGKSMHSLLMDFGAFDETTIQLYTKQLVVALAYMHSHNVIHRDLKARNVLVAQNGIVKLADFGSAKQYSNESLDLQPSVNFTYTPLWVAPEVIKGSYSSRADIWSLGCVTLEMATAKSPWAECNFANPFRALFHISRSESRPELPDTLSKPGLEFLEECFRRDPEKRP